MYYSLCGTHYGATVSRASTARSCSSTRCSTALCGARQQSCAMAKASCWVQARTERCEEASLRWWPRWRTRTPRRWSAFDWTASLLRQIQLQQQAQLVAVVVTMEFSAVQYWRVASVGTASPSPTSAQRSASPSAPAQQCSPSQPSAWHTALLLLQVKISKLRALPVRANSSSGGAVSRQSMLSLSHPSCWLRTARPRDYYVCTQLMHCAVYLIIRYLHSRHSTVHYF